MVALTSGPLFRLRTWWDYDDPLARDDVVVAVHAVFGLVAVVWLLRHGVGRAVDDVSALVAVALVAWLALGSIWSVDRSETLRQTMQIASALAVGAAATVALGQRMFRVALWVALHVGLFWSFAAIELDRAGTIDGNGDWAGVFFNRNSLALYAALGLLVTVFVVADALAERAGATWLPLVVAGGFAALVDVRLLAGSDALTPLVAATVALGAGAIARGVHRVSSPRPARAGRLATVTGLVALALGAITWLTRATWLDAFGRDSDLTGRSELWSVALDRAWQRPVHGFGYLASWGDGDFLADIERRRPDLLGSAHNAFVEMFLGAGLVGLALFVVLVVVLYRRHAVAALTGGGLVSAFGLSLLVFLVVENLTETLFVGNQLVVALFGALLVARDRRQTAP